MSPRVFSTAAFFLYPTIFYWTLLLILGCGPKLSGGPFIRLVANDFNADGIADILVGANFNSDGGGEAGAAYIFYGANTLASSVNAANANVQFIGEVASDHFGGAVSGGDINGDGISDIIVGAIDEDAGGSAAGAVYIFYGSSSLASQIDASVASVKLIGEVANDQFGYSVSSGDVNNDGYDDVIAGAIGDDTGGGSAGAAYIFFGSPSLAASIDASLANVKLIGEAAGDNLGASVFTGYINNDAFADALVGASGEDTGGSAAGAAYVFFGSNALASSIDASLANVKLIGEDANDVLGIAVSTGDVNNDGFADMIVGATGDDTGGSNAGATYLFYGSNALAASIDASAANVKLIGETAGDDLGVSVSAGDINNDGFYDVIVGAQLENTGGEDAGAAYIFYGATSLAASIDASLANVKLIGDLTFDNLGVSVYGFADINNDGFDDMIAGATGNDAGGSAAGAAYVILGSGSLTSSIDVSVANVTLIGEAATNRFGTASFL